MTMNLNFLLKGCVVVIPNPGSSVTRGTGDYMIGCYPSPPAGGACLSLDLTALTSFQLVGMGNASNRENSSQAGVRILTAMPMTMFSFGQAMKGNSGSFQISNLTFKDTSSNGSAIGAIHAIATNESVFAYDSFEGFDGYQPDPSPGVPALSYAIRMDTGPPPTGTTTVFNNNNFLLHVKAEDNSVIWDDTVNVTIPTTATPSAGNDGPIVMGGDFFPNNAHNPGVCYGFRSFGQPRLYGTHFDVSTSQSVSISSASVTSGVVTVNTVSNHNLLPGAFVTVAGITGSGVSGFNGTFTVCGPPTPGCISPVSQTFTYVDAAAMGMPAGGTPTAQASCVGALLSNSGLINGKFESSAHGGNGIETLGGGGKAAPAAISGMVRKHLSGPNFTTVKVTTAAANNFVVGQNVVISGVTPNDFNGSFTVTQVDDAMDFDYDQTGSDMFMNVGTPMATGTAASTIAIDSFFASTLNQEVTLDLGTTGVSVRDTSSSNMNKVTDNGADDNVWLTNAAGLTVTAPSANFNISQAQNSGDVILSKRQTDTGPTGNFLHFQNMAGTSDLFDLGVTGVVTEYNGEATAATSPANGISSSVGTPADLINQTGNATPPALYSPLVASHLLVNMILAVTTAGTSGAAVTATISWTGDGVAQTRKASINFGSTGNTTLSLPIFADATSSVTVSTMVSGSTVGQYSLHAWVERQ
ncbi:MAG TPA: hypothetical protein VGW33_15725 [Terriglobia bacterium]|nr:hypothetical protein [Terriglobia bacterium]